MRKPPRGLEWLEELCRHEYRSVLSLCTDRLLEEQDAQDACQETFARAVAVKAKLQTYERPGGWLMETAKHVCQESLRRRRKEMGPHVFDLDPERSVERLLWRQGEGSSKNVPRHLAHARYYHQRREDVEDRRQKLEWLAELALELPPLLRVVVQLTLRGYDPAEIAAVLGPSENAVAIRLTKARKRLRELEQWRREQGEGGT